jgi:hypothetical protein
LGVQSIRLYYPAISFKPALEGVSCYRSLLNTSGKNYTIKARVIHSYSVRTIKGKPVGYVCGVQRNNTGTSGYGACCLQGKHGCKPWLASRAGGTGGANLARRASGARCSGGARGSRRPGWTRSTSDPPCNNAATWLGTARRSHVSGVYIGWRDKKPVARAKTLGAAPVGSFYGTRATTSEVAVSQYRGECVAVSCPAVTPRTGFTSATQN